MELHAVATNVREDLAGHQYRDEGVLERDSPAKSAKPTTIATSPMLTPLKNSVTSEDSRATRIARIAMACSESDMAAISSAPYSTAPRARSSVVWANNSSCRPSGGPAALVFECGASAAFARLVDRAVPRATTGPR